MGNHAQDNATGRKGNEMGLRRKTNSLENENSSDSELFLFLSNSMVCVKIKTVLQFRAGVSSPGFKLVQTRVG